ncbi:MAG: PaaI family thioesterase [Jannaschia sp.]
MDDIRNADLDPALVEDPYDFQRLIGFRMTGWGEGYSRFDLPLEPKLLNRYGIPHGGVYACLLDTVMGFAGSFTGDPDNRRMVMTLSLTTNFLGRPVGDLLSGEGRRTGGGRSTYFAEGELTDDSGNVVATGVGTFRYRKGA